MKLTNQITCVIFFYKYFYYVGIILTRELLNYAGNKFQNKIIKVIDMLRASRTRRYNIRGTHMLLRGNRICKKNTKAL